MRIGVLDIQGSVEEHVASLERIGVEAVLVKTVADLCEVDGLIMPGGESTTIGKLLRKFGLGEAIVARAREGMPLWGTCAGAILMAGDLGLMDIDVERNAYGRQLDSFESVVEFAGAEVPAVFIRAPKIVRVGANCEVLARHGEDVVAVREGGLLATCFHPELSTDETVHRYFVGMCRV